MTTDPHILSETGGAWTKGVSAGLRSGASASHQTAEIKVKEALVGKVEDGGEVGTAGEVLDDEERGLWPTGYQKLVCASMK
jgi:hypothetical protein